VVDGKITQISTQNGKWDPELPPLQACARGAGQLERIYHPERLTHPLRRIGKRGQGKFERISWDVALDEVADQIQRVRDTYGNRAILDLSRSGSTSLLHGRGASKRFMNMIGGCTDLWSNMSAEAEIFGVRTTYGEKTHYKEAGREPTDYVNSKMILMWGWSPGDGTFGTGTMQYLKDAKRAGVKIICVDPRETRTSRTLAEEHIFIRPSTDAAALIAMAQVIVSEGLHDQAYCDRYVLGFDEAHLPVNAPAGSSYLAYLMGDADGIAKTPEWAEPLCGIPADRLRALAVEFGTTKPAALQTGYGPGRSAYGEQFHRAAYALTAITGNAGVSGGNGGSSNGATGYCGLSGIPAGKNPIDSRVAAPHLAELLQKGTAGGYPADIKLMYAAAGDLFNQCPNVNKIVDAIGSVEFFVAQDHFLTPTSRYADIVLPATTFWERNDVQTPWAGAGHYAIYMKQAIEPLGECRDDIDIFSALAKRLGIEGYNPKSEQEWLRELTEGVVDDFDTFSERGLARFPPPKNAVAFADFVQDPVRNPLSTSSGKIEIYSTAISENPNPYGLGVIPPIPTWIPQYDPDPRYPLEVCSPKSRARTHSIHGNQARLARFDPDDILIHEDDAASRGIENGALVRIFNEQGATILPANVTDKIARGVVAIKEGAWFQPNANGIDVGGCGNVLSLDRPAPSGATTYNTNQVQVEPA
jgi:anaerobic dimethyl sulfoxide reductase subunit A